LFDSLRDFIGRLEELGEVKTVRGASWDLEMGTITELMAERKGPALLFDEIPGYPRGFRVATNLFLTSRRCKVALGLREDVPDVEVVRWFKGKLDEYKPLKPQAVKEGPILENVLEGDKVDLYRFPTPKWHELDGGRYIGTGVITITRDPEEGWVNAGTYRVMIHDRSTLSFYVSPGKHARIMRERYWARGQSCPVVMVFGADPILWWTATMPLPWGMSEFDLAGWVKGKPVEVIEGKYTSLPIPATAEIAIEGESPPPSVEVMDEGPFGEWTGYYGSGMRKEPVVKVKAIYYRDDPIMHGQPPLKVSTATWPAIPLHSAPFVWRALEGAGMIGIKGVYVHGQGNRCIVVISVKQSYLGHAKQVGTAAAALYQGGACTGRWVIVVDDDIDPSNIDDVLWALSTRCDPETSIDLVRGCLDSPLDPIIPPEKRRSGDFTMTKAVILACKPYHWMKEFPPVNVASEELRKKVMEKFKDIFK
jgi:4-hydroxy-3-polyprenylbenzoate decarboxylase